MNAKIEITIEHDRDGFYGCDDNHDQPEIEEKYEKMVDAEILKFYPQVEISHKWGQFHNAGVRVYVSGVDDIYECAKIEEDVASTVMDIEAKIYSDGAFWSK